MARTTTPRKAPAKKAARTWIVIADGGHARILESGQPHSGVTIRLNLASDVRLTAGKLAADRLPRMQESANSAHHGITPRLSLKDHERRAFAARLSDYLRGGVGSFDRLVLVAPARFLNLVEEGLSDDVSRKVAKTHSKDLTWMADAEVLEHLGSLGGQVRRARVRT